MKSKSVILLGFLASLLLIFLCVFFNAERYYKELGLESKKDGLLQTVAESTPKKESESLTSSIKSASLQKKQEDSPVVDNTKNTTIDRSKISEPSKSEESNKEVPVPQETSLLTYEVIAGKQQLIGKLPLLEDGDALKTLIADCSKNTSCENNMTFFNNEEDVSWKKMATSIIELFNKGNVQNGKLSIANDEIKVEGEFQNKELKSQLALLLKNNDTEYKVSDMSTVLIPKQLKEKLKDTKSLINNKTVTSKKDIATLQSKISKLLKKKRITFKKNSGTISRKGRRVLDEVAYALFKKGFQVEVQGHTDAGGKEKINLNISQMRANSVKKYLIKKGLKSNSIHAKGFGEKQLLSPKKPYDPSNRRVEIYIKRK